jgi:hypothetical protein
MICTAYTWHVRLVTLYDYGATYFSAELDDLVASLLPLKRPRCGVSVYVYVSSYWLCLLWKAILNDKTGSSRRHQAGATGTAPCCTRRMCRIRAGHAAVTVLEPTPGVVCITVMFCCSKADKAPLTSNDRSTAAHQADLQVRSLSETCTAVSSCGVWQLLHCSAATAESAVMLC